MLLNRDAKNKLQGYRGPKATYPEHVFWAPTLGQMMVAGNINKVDNMIPTLEELTVIFLSPMSGSESNKYFISTRV